MKRLLLLLVVVVNCVTSVPLKSSMERGLRGNPWENSGKFQGDMVFSRKRNGLIDNYYRWPYGKICYTISPGFTQPQVDHIKNVYASGFSGTCIQAVECQDCCNGDYVYITNNPEDGCYAIVGRVGGPQQLNLALNCLDAGTILHEMTHALGFWHQQSTPERDDYVTIYLENVEDGKEGNFDKYGSDYVSSFDQGYDYCSIMHYSQTAFSKNGQPTVVPKWQTSCEYEIGYAQALSAVDKLKINAMYQC
ncbi:hypothetical protein PPYR_14656 [Photinus pyralis]|uniref:Metalloendopeptidase n=1 Tax=Photinus pyralis TaxID=7054 RepID=A0A5N4A5V7_PHOPY|nr:zinc metalloproteinase nas-15-like [Photinus pyralis]KAB0792697.1 hypothetical protein PPYR_14656 [Photinus pyralis]